MIELAPGDRDDVEFLSLVQRIINGAVTALEVRDVYLVETDNWFDWKWLGFWSKGARGVGPQKLRVPPFNPNRVRSERHFTWDPVSSRWAAVAQKKPLHIRQPGRSSIAQPLDVWSKSAAFIWYSGNSTTNKAGSLMFYLSGTEAYAWYASFRKDDDWKLEGERQTTRRELASFEERGRRLESGVFLGSVEASG
jgi:hypothetical protein